MAGDAVCVWGMARQVGDGEAGGVWAVGWELARLWVGENC